MKNRHEDKWHHVALQYHFVGIVKYLTVGETRSAMGLYPF